SRQEEERVEKPLAVDDTVLRELRIVPAPRGQDSQRVNAETYRRRDRREGPWRNSLPQIDQRNYWCDDQDEDQAQQHQRSTRAKVQASPIDLDRLKGYRPSTVSGSARRSSRSPCRSTRAGRRGRPGYTSACT